MAVSRNHWDPSETLPFRVMTLQPVRSSKCWTWGNKKTQTLNTYLIWFRWAHQAKIKIIDNNQGALLKLLRGSQYCTTMLEEKITSSTMFGKIPYMEEQQLSKMILSVKRLWESSLIKVITQELTFNYRALVYSTTSNLRCNLNNHTNLLVTSNNSSRMRWKEGRIQREQEVVKTITMLRQETAVRADPSPRLHKTLTLPILLSNNNIHLNSMTIIHPNSKRLRLLTNSVLSLTNLQILTSDGLTRIDKIHP